MAELHILWLHNSPAEVYVQYIVCMMYDIVCMNRYILRWYEFVLTVGIMLSNRWATSALIRVNKSSYFWSPDNWNKHERISSDIQDEDWPPSWSEMHCFITDLINYWIFHIT